MVFLRLQPEQPTRIRFSELYQEKTREEKDEKN